MEEGFIAGGCHAAVVRGDQARGSTPRRKTAKRGHVPRVLKQEPGFEQTVIRVFGYDCTSPQDHFTPPGKEVRAWTVAVAPRPQAAGVIPPPRLKGGSPVVATTTSSVQSLLANRREGSR